LEYCIQAGKKEQHGWIRFAHHGKESNDRLV